MRLARRRNIQWLFARATEIASLGQEIAVDGQSPHHAAGRYASLAKLLHQNSLELANAAADIMAALAGGS
jgi:hypothetical protein